MNSGQVIDLLRQALYTATMITAPILIICLVVGIVISIFQAATQIHEQSLSFVPKIVIVLIFIVVAGNWMVTVLSDFAKQIFSYISNLR
ncbi:putative membrane protein [[Clostridium] cellulosi]|jgi:flagellar biosynthetic protein FliQ|uniref:Flagellar biosynthetic protein FliQ n=1 Tax=[Clostridium] cellulosi TaxID=29343 RepID=A0A078KQT6_9FIRM|nr:MAG: flagellar biosynthetic protein FliQ [[Clostridium] cellulosi]CDZ23510.1 putative membrane protein [[Clostridium] cellulosi]